MTHAGLIWDQSVMCYYSLICDISISPTATLSYCVRGLGFLVIDLCVSADVEAFARAMQGSREESKEKKDEEDMSLD